MFQINISSVTHVVDPNYVGETKRKPVITVVNLELEINTSTFQGGKARLKCVAKLFNLYTAQTEQILEEENPKPSSVLGTRSSSPGENNIILFYFISYFYKERFNF